jgi:hypothetical protein
MFGSEQTAPQFLPKIMWRRQWQLWGPEDSVRKHGGKEKTMSTLNGDSADPTVAGVTGLNKGKKTIWRQWWDGEWKASSALIRVFLT